MRSRMFKYSLINCIHLGKCIFIIYLAKKKFTLFKVFIFLFFIFYFSSFILACHHLFTSDIFYYNSFIMSHHGYSQTSRRRIAGRRIAFAYYHCMARQRCCFFLTTSSLFDFEFAKTPAFVDLRQADLI